MSILNKPVLLGGLLAALAMAVQAADSAPTGKVKGRAPDVVIAGVDNLSVPGQAVATGHVLRVRATVSDPDGDTISGTGYQWLRDGAEVGAEATYTTVATDADKTLTVKVVAATDPLITDPASAEASQAVPVAMNSAPVASGLTITGTTTVGKTLTGNYSYSDADDDGEGISIFQWYRDGTSISGAVNSTYTPVGEDGGRTLAFGVIPKSTTGTANTGSEVRVSTAAVSLAEISSQGLTFYIPNNQKAGADWSTANTRCVSSGGRLPTVAELTQLFVDATSSSNNKEMCSVYGWPLVADCGGITGHYRSSTLESAGHHSTVYMTMGTINSHLDDSFAGHVACAR